MSDTYNFDPVEGNLTCSSIGTYDGMMELGDVTSSVTHPVGNLTIAENITIDTTSSVLTEYVTVNLGEAESGNIILNENIC